VWQDAAVEAGDEAVLLVKLVGVQIKKKKYFTPLLTVSKVKLVETEPEFLPVERDVSDAE